MKMLQLARSGRFGTKPSRQLVGERINLARPLRRGELRFDNLRDQLFRDRVPRRTGAPRDLADENYASHRLTFRVKLRSGQLKRSRALIKALRDLQPDMTVHENLPEG